MYVQCTNVVILCSDTKLCIKKYKDGLVDTFIYISCLPISIANSGLQHLASLNFVTAKSFEADCPK